MKRHANIFLVGPMGAGKSTIGRILAKNLNLDFVDLDAEIEKRCGADIPWIFDMEGEAGFRKRESTLLAEASSAQRILMATGGGAVLAEVNRKCLSERGMVVYLSATIEQLVERTCRDRKRPLLQVDNPKEVITQLFEERDPLYRKVADFIVKTENKTPTLVAREIEEKIRT